MLSLTLARLFAQTYRPNAKQMQSLYVALAICLFVPTAFGQNEHLIERALKLSALKPSPTRCELGIESQFLDNARLLVSNPICAKGGVDSGYQIAIVSLDGTISTSIDLDDNSRYPRVGPHGYVLIPAGRTGWLIFDEQLHPLGNVPAHTGESEGGIVLSPSRTAVAVIFTRADGYSYPWRYIVLAGHQLESKGEYTISEGFPAITDSGSVDTSAQGKAGLYEVSAGDLWYFDKANNHHLSRRSSTGSTTVLPNALWLSPDKTETWCSAQLSTVKPWRFLAHCKGDTTFGLGKASVGRGHNRFVVYDAEGRTLFKKALSGDSSVSLSPDGGLIAISHGKSIHLYQVR